MYDNMEYFSTFLVGGYFCPDWVMSPTSGTAKLLLLLELYQGIGLKEKPGVHVTTGNLIP